MGDCIFKINREQAENESNCQVEVTIYNTLHVLILMLSKSKFEASCENFIYPRRYEGRMTPLINFCVLCLLWMAENKRAVSKSSNIMSITINLNVFKHNAQKPQFNKINRIWENTVQYIHCYNITQQNNQWGDTQSWE